MSCARTEGQPRGTLGSPGLQESFAICDYILSPTTLKAVWAVHFFFFFYLSSVLEVLEYFFCSFIFLEVVQKVFGDVRDSLSFILFLLLLGVIQSRLKAMECSH